MALRRLSRRNVLLILGLIGLCILIGSVFLFSNPKGVLKTQGSDELIPTSPTPTKTSFTASFEIITLGTKRVFTQSMYHYQSPRVYIEDRDPSTIHVNDLGVTWGDFFDTLPLTLNQSCLITGNKETYCNNEQNKLSFILNNTNTPKSLEMEIRSGDHLIVRYGR